MDPEVSVLLHCAGWRGLVQSQVAVELSERFNRQTDPALDRHIEEVWAERMSKEPWLFNGAKFRLHTYCFTSAKYSSSSCTSPSHATCTHSSEVQSLAYDATKTSMDLRTESVNQANNVQCIAQQKTNQTRAGLQDTGPVLTLRLGLTCYKDYLGTNWSCQVAELRQRGWTEFGDPLVLLAQPLGVGAVLCTDDGQVVLIRRSQKVAEAGGLLDIPGGHPEPQVVCEQLGHAVPDKISMVMMQQRPEIVVSELFASVCAEIRDEVNVPLSCLGDPVLMGIALNHTSSGRPSAEFYVSCSLTSDEVRTLYWKGGAEANESTDIVFLSREEVLQLDINSALWSELCPSAKGAVLLYRTVKPDGE